MKWLLIAIHGQAVSICAALEMGIAKADITPGFGDGHPPVWLAGYGQGRLAKDVHDPLFVRAVVLGDGKKGGKRLALVSVDLVGLQRPAVLRIRELLPGFEHVLVSSTHNHEGPDVIGLWGPNPLRSGVNGEYIDLVIERSAEAVREAAKNLLPVTASFGTAKDDTLLGDSRLPKAVDGVLRVLRFRNVESGADEGMLVQWNCHPEAMGSSNTSITADFTSPVVERLEKKFDCPVAYFTGTVGGLMAPPRNRIRGEDGEMLREGDWEYMRRYGEAVAELAKLAAKNARPVRMTPFDIATRPLQLRVDNKIYRAAFLGELVPRDGYVWSGPEKRGEPFHGLRHALRTMAVETEVSFLRLGDVGLAAIPGEIYPELVYGAFEEPVAEGSDFPEAGLEPVVANMMPTEHWMLVGLASDEIGYILPKRQWDARKPFAYGRSSPQYGEINSCGPETARLVMEALSKCVTASSKGR